MSMSHFVILFRETSAFLEKRTVQGPWLEIRGPEVKVFLMEQRQLAQEVVVSKTG